MLNDLIRLWRKRVRSSSRSLNKQSALVVKGNASTKFATKVCSVHRGRGLLALVSPVQYLLFLWKRWRAVAIAALRPCSSEEGGHFELALERCNAKSALLTCCRILQTIRARKSERFERQYWKPTKIGEHRKNTIDTNLSGV